MISADTSSRWQRATLFVLLLLLGQPVPNGAVQAQAIEGSGEGAPGGTFTLAEAVSRAVEANPDFEILQARLDQQQAGIRVLLARLLPNASVTGSFTHNDQGVQLGGSTVVQQDEMTWSGSLSLTLFRPRALKDYLVGRREMEAARLETRFSRSNLTLAVIELYIGLVRAQASRLAAETSLARRESFLAAARERLRHGLADRGELQRSELTVLAALSQLEQSRAQEALTQEALAVVLDLPAGTQIVPTGELAPPGFERHSAEVGMPPAVLAEESRVALEETVITLEELESGFAPENRDDLEAALQLERRDDLARLFTWLDFLPEVLLSAGFTQGPSTFRDPDGFSWQVVLRAVFTLYDGGQRYGLMDQEEAIRALHRAELRSTRAQARSEVRTAALAVQSWEQQLAIAERALVISREYWSDTIRRLDVGLASLLEVLDAEEQLSTYEVRAQVLKEDLWLAQWQLVHARGELLEVF
ncbi:MAG: TolC family protein [Bradymonadales bacterium]|nr:TolC family protein [Bradymonadales bacterium]